MRCHICNKVLEDPKFNRDADEWDPCETCLLIVADTLAGYIDTPVAEEDAFGDDFPHELEGYDEKNFSYWYTENP